ncbi:unnamed protein product [Lactuca saligna]|uniref:Uncharacterized protein n=1 Tax=Lactuca saligna TaxID=75948 RepID=A0AA35YXS4_LACSI|nr:unnamed protein product [Lactuca saligna]
MLKETHLPNTKLAPFKNLKLDAMSVAIRSMLLVVAAIPLYLWLRREVSQSDEEEPQAGKSNGRRNYGYRWKNMWAFVPNIKIDDKLLWDGEVEVDVSATSIAFVEFVEKVLGLQLMVFKGLISRSMLQILDIINIMDI